MWNVDGRSATNDKIERATALQFWESLLFPDQPAGKYLIDASSREALARTVLETLNGPMDAHAQALVSGPAADAVDLQLEHATGDWWDILHLHLTYYTVEHGWWYVELMLRFEGGAWRPQLEIRGKRMHLPDRLRTALERAQIKIPAI